MAHAIACRAGSTGLPVAGYVPAFPDFRATRHFARSRAASSAARHRGFVFRQVRMDVISCIAGETVLAVMTVSTL